MAAKHITSAEFQELVMDYTAANPVFKGSKPAIVDFFAPWCGPCQAFSPVFDELAEEYEGRVDCYKVNVEEEQALAQTLRVRNIPTLIFFPKGSNPKASVGAMSKTELINIIKEDFQIK